MRGMEEPMAEGDLKKAFEKNGYIHIKKLFDESEVSHIRRVCAEINRDNQDVLERDNLTFPEIREILTQKKVVDIVKQILGPEVIYFGEGTIAYGDFNKPHFHKDSRADPHDPQEVDYPVVRTGIYLQDHKNFGGGLKVRRGSHRHVHFTRENLKRLLPNKKGRLRLSSFRIGKAVNLPIEAGDFLLWSMRTDHSPNFVRLKFAPNLVLPPSIEKIVPKSLRVPEEKSRMVIFTAFGKKNKLMDAYAIQRSRKISAEFWRESTFSNEDCIEYCQSRGLQIDLVAHQNAITQGSTSENIGASAN